MSTIVDALQAGLDYHRAGRLHDAEAMYRRVLEMHPRHAQAIHLLGLIAYQVGKHEEAINLLNAATQIDRFNAVFHADLGEICRAAGKVPEAVAACVRAIELNPNLADVHNCLGQLHRTEGRQEEAVACFRAVLELDPDHSAAHANLGAALWVLRQLPEAQAAFERAVKLKPDDSENYHGLGVCLYDQGKVLDAIACYERTLRLAPGNAKAQFNIALARLLRGDFANGWQGFELRHSIYEGLVNQYALPMWNGAVPAGGPVLVHAEQGFGDTLQFARYLPLLEERGVIAYFDVHEELFSLFAQSGFKHLQTGGAAPPECTSHVPLLSLPRIFGTTLQSIPAKVPYVSVREDLVAKWRRRLGAHRGLRVGINWQGQHRYYNDRARSIPLAQFAPLAKVEGVQWVSLQKSPGTEQLSELAATWPIVDLSDELVDFHETAAVIGNLDLVISCDSASAHLAGALGKPVWVALPVGCDWRWMQGRDDSPWYPTMRLFRQQKLGAWEDVVGRIAGELSALSGAHRTTGA